MRESPNWQNGFLSDPFNAKWGRHPQPWHRKPLRANIGRFQAPKFQPSEAMSVISTAPSVAWESHGNGHRTKKNRQTCRIMAERWFARSRYGFFGRLNARAQDDGKHGKPEFGDGKAAVSSPAVHMRANVVQEQDLLPLISRLHVTELVYFEGKFRCCLIFMVLCWRWFALHRREVMEVGQRTPSSGKQSLELRLLICSHDPWQIHTRTQHSQ